MARVLALLTCLIAFSVPAAARTGSGPGYTVTRRADGVEIVVHFDRRAYAAHALIPVTATLRNLSHPRLAISRFGGTYGPCSSPPMAFTSVNAAGQSAEPVPRIPRPVLHCAAGRVEWVPSGHSVVQHELVVLWSSRLRLDARLGSSTNACFCEFSGPGAFVVPFRLHPASVPHIALRTATRGEMAVVTAPPGARGPMYYESWGSCATYVPYWTARNRRMVSPGCANPKQWHLEVAWLNGPVATLEVGGSR